MTDPWTRVRTPYPIPDDCSPSVLERMTDSDFAELLRSHLVPRDQTPAGRQAWERLWRDLSHHDRAAERTLGVLDSFLERVDAALASGNLDPAQARRATKFREQCEMALNRTERDDGGSLAWAGAAGDFPPQAARVIAMLVSAVAKHRSRVRRAGSSSESDRNLWATLRQVGLDPEDFA